MQIEGIVLDTGDIFRTPYDELLIATGTSPLRPDFTCTDCPNVHDVNSLPAGTRLKQSLAESNYRKACVLGGGYIGIEMAEALHQRGLQVTLIQRGPQLMQTLDADMADQLLEAMRMAGITVLLNEPATDFAQQSGKVEAVITRHKEIATELVVLGLGVRPNSDIAARAGIGLGPKKSIKIDACQQTDTAHIWAAGDCAQSMHLVSGQAVHIALGTVANRQGRVAGLNLAGRKTLFPGVLGTAITKFMDTECARTGLNEKELQQLGYDYVVGRVDGSTLPRYYPGGAPIAVKVLADRNTGRLLGAQIVGGKGSAKRIDVAATALMAGLSLEQMLYLDLSYAPPFSGVWDPLVIACRLALKEL
jgi:NADPH-dependent 2,4-dienoyl-CoA reductase/sulfur reductase-like enzyme